MNTRRWIAIGLAAVATAAAATTTAAAAPAQHAYLQQDLQRDLDAITATGVPGVLAEVRTGDRQLRGTSGVANLVSRKPVNAHGFFRIGSNTKTFVSVVVLQLVAEHRLSLDDTVGRWLARRGPRQWQRWRQDHRPRAAAAHLRPAQLHR
jgi:D-alanyl-D-alanine carboxypeptidase